MQRQATMLVLMTLVAGITGYLMLYERQVGPARENAPKSALPTDTAQPIERIERAVLPALISTPSDFNLSGIVRSHRLWERALNPDPALIPPRGVMAKNAELMQIKLNDKPSVGEVIEFQLPQTGTKVHLASIEVVDDRATSTSYRGTILQNELPFPFAITISQDQFFATVNTIDGQFEAAGTHELAWVYRSDSMNDQLAGSPADFREADTDREEVSSQPALPSELPRPPDSELSGDFGFRAPDRE